MAGICDWLDVFNHPAGGPEAVRLGLLAGVVVSADPHEPDEIDDEAPAPPPSPPSPPPPPATFDGQGDCPEPLRLPADHIARAHKYINEAFLSADGRSGELVSVGAQLHRYERDSGRWIRVDDPYVLSDIKRWAGPLWRQKERKGATVWAPANLTNREAADLLESLRLELLIDLEGSRNDRGQIQPGRFWMRGTQHAAERYRGGPVPVARPWERLCADPEAEGLPPASMLLPLTDGLLDLAAWDRGQVVRMEHTTRLFNLNRYPYRLPWDQLRAAQRDAERAAARQEEECPTAPLDAMRVRLEAFAAGVEAISRRLAPRWWAFLAEALGMAPAAGATFRDADDEARQRSLCELAYAESLRELAKFGGYLLACDVRHHKGNVFVLHGPPGSGKGTVGRVFARVLGADNVVSLSIEQLGRQEYLHACMGKSLVFMPDERPANLEAAREGAGAMKKISGGDSVSFRALFNAPVTNVQLFCRFLMAVNEMPHLADEALVRRMVVVEFSRVAERPDLGLDDALAEPGERLGQLLWMLLGRLWLRADGRFIQPEASRTALDVYEREADKYTGFVAECLEVTGDEEHVVSKPAIAELYAAYAAAEHGHTKFPSVDRVMAGVWPAVRKLWPESQHRVTSTQPRDGDRRLPRVLKGMRIRPEAAVRYAPPEDKPREWRPDPGPGLGYGKD